MTTRPGIRHQSQSSAVEHPAKTDAAKASVDQLLAAVSHDLRMPLTAIALFAHALESPAQRISTSESQAINDLAHRIAEAASEGLAMVDELIEMAQAGANSLANLARSPTDLAALVRESVLEHQSATIELQIHLILRDQVVGNWDSGRLKRVVDNLLSNATKYSRAGSDIWIEVSTKQLHAQPWAVLTIRDSGPGIPAGEASSVFDWYARGSNVGRRPGAGIGLASTRRIVELHGGSVTVATREGVGSVFTVRLPIG